MTVPPAGREPKANRQRPRSTPVVQPPLGSLSQGDDMLVPGGTVCASCAGPSLTRLRMTLGDGTPVVFVSCHRCEERSWFTLDGVGTQLTRDDVISRSAKR